MGQSEHEEAIKTVAERRAPGWQVRIAPGPAGRQAGLEVELRHAASHGLDFTLPQDTPDPAAWLDQALASNQEIEVVATAPVLENQALVMGIRTLVDAFDWDSREVGGLALLLHETGALTGPEASWLAGFCGDGAPMEPVTTAGG